MHPSAVAPASSPAMPLLEGIHYHLRYTLGKSLAEVGKRDIYQALAHAVRQRLVDGMLSTESRIQQAQARHLVYLSAEFLIGQSLRNNLFNLSLLKEAELATKTFGFNLDTITDSEPDAPLGNGGLGRLAACFMESAASLSMPAYGYGINYQFGLFKQEIDNGFQKERPEQWLSEDSPWLIKRAEACVVPLYGRVEHNRDRDGNYNPMWVEWDVIVGVPYDIPVVGFGGDTVNYLRLYSARASDEFDMQIFNEGDYIRAVDRKIAMETISKVLYPSDAVAAGKELRLVQEYFMVACALRDIVRKFAKDHSNCSMEQFANHYAIQMNDTHPALVVAELMRILVDEFALSWDAAWNVTQQCCGYTNHTLLPEALEKWPVQLLERVLPRHMQIILEINQRFLATVAERFPSDNGRLSRMSIIEEGPHRHVRMANLAIVGSHSVNGVAALHSDLVKTKLVPDFNDLWPEKFNNKTNGVTHRRWLGCANPGLAALITEIAGPGWITDFTRVNALEPLAAHTSTQAAFLDIKNNNKKQLARMIRELEQITVDPDSLFDVQVKRIHEYKRQLLNVMHIIHCYLKAIDEGVYPTAPRTCIFGGKAAPGYAMAKLIIKLINNVARIVNGDSRMSSHLKVVFMHDYRVSLAERIIPAADLSEQISTAGMEASGTGNMKFAMNGALTIGTLDGANVEIRDEVGEENIYIFGLTAQQVEEKRATYSPWQPYQNSTDVQRVVDALRDDRFCQESPGLFLPIYNALMLEGDYYFHLADFDAYIAAQEQVSSDFLDSSEWARTAILNVARTGKFSSDRTIKEYAQDIWGVRAIAR